MEILVAIIVSIVLSVLAYALAPKPKQPKPAAAADFESPTAEAGRPVPVAFGTITIKGVNILGTWDKQVREYEVKV